LPGVLDAYLRLNELVVQNGERIPKDGHTPFELDQQSQRFLRDCQRLWIHKPYFVTSK